MLEAWAPLLWTLVLVAALWWVSRRFAFFFMSAVLELTHSERTASGFYAIFILPGTIMHEASHWLMAKLVGVKTGQVRLLPTLSNTGIRLGSVDVRGGRLWQLTLIGLAPLLVGSLLTLWLSYSLFDVERLAAVSADGRGKILLAVFVAALRQPDAFLLLYLLFTVSDAMLLSASDWAPIQRMVLYVGLLLLIILFLFGGMPVLPERWTAAIQKAFQAYAFGLGMTLFLHLVLLALSAVGYFLMLSLLRILRRG